MSYEAKDIKSLFVQTFGNCDNLKTAYILSDKLNFVGEDFLPKETKLFVLPSAIEKIKHENAIALSIDDLVSHNTSLKDINKLVLDLKDNENFIL